MLRISWTGHKTNEYVLNQIGQKPTVVNKIDRSKLQYFGHICRRQDDNIEKIIMQGCIEGSRRQGRQKLRWTDGIKQLTGLSLVAAHRLAQDRAIWKSIINRVTKGQT